MRGNEGFRKLGSVVEKLSQRTLKQNTLVEMEKVEPGDRYVVDECVF